MYCIMDNHLVLFHCKFCQQKATCITSHIRHLRCHRHLRHYIHCGLGHCGSLFKTEQSLRLHVFRSHRVYAAHTKMKKSTVLPVNSSAQYQCPIQTCSTQFLVYQNFLNHLKLHFNENSDVPCPFIDRGCTKTFSLYKSLTGHVSKKHKTVLLQPQPLPQPPAPAVRSIQEESNIEDSVVVPYDSDVEEDFCSEILVDKGQPKDDLLVSVAQFYQKLEYKHMVPGSVTQVVAKEVRTLLMELQTSFIQNVSSVLQSEGISSEVISEAAFSLSQNSTVLQVCNDLRSVYMRKQFYKKRFNFVLPEQVPLENGNFFYYVPIDQTIKAAFKNKSLNFYIRQPPFSQFGTLKDFFDGDAFKNNVFFKENPTAIPLILFQDGFQVVCPIGAAKNLKHKFLGVYMAFGNLDPEIRYQKDSIQLVALLRETDLSHREIFGKIAEDILKLQESGVNVPDVGNVKAGLAFVAGDNLGSHGLGGFVENFSSSTFFCRYCLITRDLFYNKEGGEVRKFPERTPASHDRALRRVRVSRSGKVKSCQGVKFNSELNKIKGYHVCNGFPCCLGHDLCEGVVAHDLKLFIKYFVSEGWFTLPEFNKMLATFPFCVKDNKDRPPPIKNIDKEKLAGGAWQVWQFLRLFPLIVHGYVKDYNDPVWKCMLRLREIVEVAVAPEFHISHLDSFQCMIDEYLVLRKCLFPTVPLRPKHHYLFHYPDLIRLFGPLIKVWTLRFECKHSFFKRSWRSSQNSINVLQSLSFKHEFLQSWIRSGGGAFCAVECGGRVPFDRSVYSDAVLSALRRYSSYSSLDECPWVKIKGTLYQKGCVVILSQIGFDKYVVGVIHLFLIDCHERVTFLVKRAVARLQHIVGAYAITVGNDMECVSPDALISYHPLYTYPRDSKIYVCLKHALVGMEWKCFE